MNEVYDTKFGLLNSRFFFLLLLLFLPFLAFAGKYTEADIPILMQKLLEKHVDYQKLDVNLMQRIIKIYINQFDYQKSYLMKEDIKNFINISNRELRGIIKNVQKGDFSFFYKINEVLATAIQRAKENRKNFNTEIFSENTSRKARSGYAKDEEDLFLRQKEDFSFFYLCHRRISRIDSKEKREKLLSLFHRKKERIEKKYLEPKEFGINFLKAFSKGLDAHTDVFTRQRARDIRRSLEMNFEGVGIVLFETIDGAVIREVIEGSPAFESNRIFKGDIIVGVNGKNVENLVFEDVLDLLKKRIHGKVSLQLKRSSKVEEVVLKPRAIKQKEGFSYSYETCKDGIIGKLVLRSFYENENGVSSERDIKMAIRSLRKKGKVKGIILDLRENAGGFLSQAIRVAGLFMKNGVVVISKYNEKEVRYLRNIDERIYYGGPLIILTSKMSASAAEIVAGTLQDYGVGIVVGDERTFGKGTIQYQTITDKDAKYFYKVTVGRYYTVSGRSTQKEGVKADIVVPSIYHSYDIGEKYLKYSLKSDKVKAAFNDDLHDIPQKLKRLFELNYLPGIQKRVKFWRNMLSVLRKNAKDRMRMDSSFQVYMENIQSQEKKEIEDYPMKAAIDVIKDMIDMEKKSLKIAEEKFFSK